MGTNQTILQNTQADEQNVIHFDDGILGFEEVKEYLLYHEDEDGVIWSLQAARADVPSFIVVDPYPFISDYNAQLTQAELAYFGETGTENLCVLVVAVIKPNLKDSVVNLKAPIVIDVNSKKAKQIILENGDYPIRFKLFADKE